jgi:hypothetical protein
MALPRAIVTGFEDRQWLKIGYPQEHRPFVVQRTAEINKFTKNVFFTWCRLYQEILGYSQPGPLPEEQQKLGYLVIKVMRNSKGLANLTRETVIWKGSYNY